MKKNKLNNPTTKLSRAASKAQKTETPLDKPKTKAALAPAHFVRRQKLKTPVFSSSVSLSLCPIASRLLLSLEKSPRKSSEIRQLIDNQMSKLHYAFELEMMRASIKIYNALMDGMTPQRIRALKG